jgi:flagellar hook-associated protein 1
MSLSHVLNTSLSGLRATQAGLSLVASNVANAQTPGYVRKSLLVEASIGNEVSNGVRIIGVERELDAFVQRQFRVETSGGAYADLRVEFLRRLQQVYGEPGAESALESIFNKFTNALQSLMTSPDLVAARTMVISSAQVLAQNLNKMTTDIQALRADAETSLANAVTAANNAIERIAAINYQLGAVNTRTAADAKLADERDNYINQLTELMDIRVVRTGDNQVDIITNSGIQLVGAGGALLAFNAQGTITPATVWDADPTKRTLGTLSVITGGGQSMDLIANNAIRSGKIAALIDMRDNVLVQAQTQLDALAAAMAQALSNETINGAVVSLPPQAGFDVDTAGLLPGNTVNLTYTDHFTNIQHNVKIVWVADPAALPLNDAMTADGNDEVIGVDISAGLSSIVAQLNLKFGNRLQFSNPAGTTLRVLDDGAVNLSTVSALSATRTTTVLNGNSTSLAFFTDGTSPYTGAFTSVAPQSLGFAGRIAVNPLLAADSSKLVLYGGNTAVGNPARPNFIYQQLTGTPMAFPSDVGFGTASTPFAGTLHGFMRQVLSMQGEAAANAESLAEGQRVVVDSLKQRLDDTSGVNIDQEMARLIALQTAYGANARVMSTVRELLDALMAIL